MDYKLAFIGDISLNGIISSESDKNDERFRKVEEEFFHYDFIFANLESLVEVKNEINEFKQKQGVINTANGLVIGKILKRLNISAVSLANNHVLDNNIGGLIATEKVLKKNKIDYIGASSNAKIKPYVLKMGRNEIVIISYVHPQTNPGLNSKTKNLVNIYKKEKILKEINRLKKEYDLIILSSHWGRDYSNFPIKQQTIDYQEFIDAGCKIIIGHHSHTMQPYVKYKEGYIFYSLGQLCFGDFIWDNKNASLKRKTKHAAFPVFDENLELIKFITTKEVKGNYIKLTNWNYRAWSKRILSLHKLYLSHYSIRMAVIIKETLIDRIIEFFFGYYRNPIKQLISFRNIKKVRFLIRDFKKHKKG